MLFYPEVDKNLEFNLKQLFLFVSTAWSNRKWQNKQSKMTLTFLTQRSASLDVKYLQQNMKKKIIASKECVVITHGNGLICSC